MKAKQYLDPSPEIIKSLLKISKARDFFVLDKKLEVQLKKFPNSSFLHNLKGSSLSNQNRLEESLKSFNIALQSAKKPEVILNNIGLTITNEAQIRKKVKIFNDAGFQVAIHCIGDKANRIALNIFEEIDSKSILLN